MAVIDRIVIENFKSLRKVDLSLGRLNLFIGTNASGKSNFLDALRVLQGIGNGFTISEILDGKARSATSEVWDGVRGGSDGACFAGIGQAGGSAASAGAGIDQVVTVGAHGNLRDAVAPAWEFLMAFSPAAGRVSGERLSVGTGVYDSDCDHAMNVYQPRGRPEIEVRCHPKEAGDPFVGRFERARPVLGQIAGGSLWDTVSISTLTRMDDVKWQTDCASRVAASLASAQSLDPMPARLRSYADDPRARRMGEHGENFAALVDWLCQNEETRQAYLSWLQELRPEEVSQVGVLRGAVSEPLFMLREGDRELPAPVLSDGTLRFAALAAAFFQPDMPQIMTIEDVENGVHPSRLRLILELLRSQAERTRTQVFATTHSPLLLAWLQEEEYETTFFCRRDERTGESEIRPLSKVPHLVDIVRKPGQHLSDLFAEGWLEAAL